jgi:hypothetical protein
MPIRGTRRARLVVARFTGTPIAKIGGTPFRARSIAMKQAIFSTVAVLGLVVGQAALAQGSPTTIDLKAQNNSGESGTVTMTPQGDKTQIVVKVTGAPAGVAQPAHIHDGTCAKLDPKPRIPLQNVINGTSTTVVGVKLDEIMKQGGAINVHKSAEEAKVYVACGDLKAMK